MILRQYLIRFSNHLFLRWKFRNLCRNARRCNLRFYFSIKCRRRNDKFWQAFKSTVAIDYDLYFPQFYSFLRSFSVACIDQIQTCRHYFDLKAILQQFVSTERQRLKFSKPNIGYLQVLHFTSVNYYFTIQLVKFTWLRFIILKAFYITSGPLLQS